MSTSLTRRQHAVVAAIIDFFVAHGRIPTTRELARAIGCRSTSTAHSHLIALTRKGILRRDNGHIEFSESVLRTLVNAPHA